MVYIHTAFFICPSVSAKNRPGFHCGNRGGSFALWVLFSGVHAKPCEGSFGKPRICGEKSFVYASLLSMLGSPPHMRGKVDRQLDVGVHAGITPACAGKSVWQRLPLAQARDHPRVCGEKNQSVENGWTGVGSPPRMRGKAAAVDITSTLTRDHPRACGEKTKKIP